MSYTPPLPCLEHGEGEGVCEGVDGKRYTGMTAIRNNNALLFIIKM